MEGAIRVVIADPHPVVIGGIRSFLAGSKDIQVVGDCSELRYIHEVCLKEEAHVLLVGHALEEADWKSLSRIRHANGLFVAVMAVTAVRDANTLCQTLQGGCRGIYDKADSLEQLPVAIRTVSQGSLWFRDKDAHHVVESLLKQGRGTVQTRKIPTQLTERQQRIVSLVVRGLSNAEIAQAVRVSQATVALDLSRVYKILGVADRVRLLVKVHAEGGPKPLDMELPTQSETESEALHPA